MLNVIRPLKWVALFSFYSLQAIAQTGYNEIRDEAGNVRPLYKDIVPMVENLSLAETEKFLKESKRAFFGDNALDPMPRILSAREFGELERGVQQRSQALVLFLKDYFSGERKFEKAGVIPKGLIDTIAARNADHLYQGLVKAKEIHFFYGPDIIRDQNGVWRVIEDNPGYIGGIGDLKIAQEIMLRQFPQIPKVLNVRHADGFYERLASQFKDIAKRNGGKAIIYMQPPFSDNEETRIQEIFPSYGVEVITPKMAHKKMVVKDDGVYIDQFVKGQHVLEKVGYMFMNGEHAWLDPEHVISRQRNLLEAAGDLLAQPDVHPLVKRRVSQILEKVDPVTRLPDLNLLRAHVDHFYPFLWKSRSKVPGLLQAILDGKLATNYTPGIDFIGDKQFYMYVEDIIRFYLKQEPIIRNIPTRSFADANGNLDQALFDKIFADHKPFVTKTVDGRGGDGVLVGPKAEAQEIQEYAIRVKANPKKFINQDYLFLSEHNGNIVDSRVIAMVFDINAFVSPTPWGRGLPKDGNGKVNLSDKGREVTIFVADDKPSAATIQPTDGPKKSPKDRTSFEMPNPYIVNQISCELILR